MSSSVVNNTPTDGISAGIKPDLIDTETILDYLLFKLNLRDPKSRKCCSIGNFSLTYYLDPPFTGQLPLGETYPPTNDIHTLLEDLGRRVGALRKGGHVDMDNASQFLMNAMRNGKFGRWTLDDFAGETFDETIDARVHSTLETFLQRQQETIDKDSERRSKTSILKEAKLEAAKQRKAKLKNKFG